MMTSTTVRCWGLAALIFAACSPQSSPTTGTQALATCEIASPAPGAAFGAADDLDLATPDLQIDVDLRVAGASVGSVLQLELNGVVAQARVLDAAAGTFRFQGVTLPRGPAVARVGCSILGSSAHAEASVSVGESCSLAIARPSMGQSVGIADTRAGVGGRMVYTVEVQASGLPAGTPVQLLLGEDAAPQFQATGTLSPGSATFEVPAYQGQGRVYARALGAACSPAAEVRYLVELGQCAAQLVLPRTFNGAVDRSPAPGLQTRLCVSTQCADGSTATVSVDGTSELQAPVVNGQACFEVTLPEGAPSVTARVDGQAQSGVAPPARPCVDVTAPVVALSYPQSGLTLGARDDRDPSTPGVLDLAIGGVVDGLNEGCIASGSTGRIEILVNGEVQHAFSPDDSRGLFERVARLLPGQNTVQVCAADAVENRSCSAPSRVTFESALPALRFVSPAAGTTLNAASPAFAISMVAERLPKGTLVSLQSDDGRFACEAPVTLADGTLTATFSVGTGCPALGDGAWRLQGRAVDALGNVALSPFLALAIDTSAPALVFNSPADGEQTRAEAIDVTLKTDVADGTAVSLIVEDGAPIVASALGGGVTFREVKLAEGQTRLVAIVRDPAGNETTAIRTVTRDTHVPAPVFTNLTRGVVLGVADDADQDLGNGLQYDVRVAVADEADGARVSLVVEGGTLRQLPLTEGSALFTGVALAEGVNRVSAFVQDAAGNVGRADLEVVVATGRPQVTLAEPRDGAVFAARHDVDPSSPGVQVPVVVNVSGAAGLTSCVLELQSGTSTRRQELPYAAGACRGVVTLDEGQSVLTARVESQVPGASLQSLVTVDTVAPTVDFVAPVGDYLNADSPDVDGRPGFQTDVVVVADIEEGQGATLRVTDEQTGVVTTYAATFAAGGTATFGAVTLGEASSSYLEVEAADSAGNAAKPRSRRVVVDREPPTVRLASPLNGQLFGLAADESPEAGFQMSVTVEVDGVEAGRVAALTVAGAGDVTTTYLSAPLSAGSQRVVFPAVTLPIAASGHVTLSVTATDAAGNRASDRSVIRIDREQGLLSWTYPQAVSAPTVLCGGAQHEVVLATSGLETGTVVVVSDARGVEVGRGIVVGGSASVPVSLPSGDSTLSARASRASGNVAATAETRTVRLDAEGPAVVSITCDGDRDGDGYLSRGEDQSPSSSSSFEMVCAVTFTDDGVHGRTVELLSTSPALGSVVGLGIATGNVAYVPVSLAGGASAVGHVLTARSSDACGNASGGSASYSATVELGAPAVSITAPVAGTTLLASHDLVSSTDAQFECCTGPSGAYDLTALTVGAVGNARLYVNGAPSAGAPIGLGGLVRFPGIVLPQGEVSLVVEAANAAGSATASAPVTVFVDSIAPKLSIASPSTGVVGSGALTVQVQYRDVEAGQLLRLYDGLRLVGETRAAAGAEGSARTAIFPLLLQPGSHGFTAQAADLAGNVGASALVAVDVQGTESLISFETPTGNPMIISRTNGGLQGAQLLTQVWARTPAPIGSLATLYKNGAVVGSATVEYGRPLNLATFVVPLNDGEAGNLQLRVKTDPLAADAACPGDAVNFCSAAVPFTVLLSAPSLSFSAPTCKTTWSLADRDASGQFTVAIATNAHDGHEVRLSSTLGGLDQRVGAAGGFATFSGLALAEGQQTLEARVTDVAGNVNYVRCGVQVDTQGPTVSTLTATRSAARRDRVTLGFTMPGDDGLSGRVASYELRYKVCPLGTACAISAADFASATAVTSLPSIVEGGAAMSVDVDGLPLDSSLGFALRATDDAGNVSALSTVEAQTPWSTDGSVVGSAGETDFGVALRAVSLRGDSKTDLVIGRAGLSTNKGGARFVYGDGSTPTEITAAQVGLGSTASARLGRAIAGAGDVDGDGYEDVLIAAPGVANATCTAGGASTGKVFLFFGGPTGVSGGAAPVSCATAGASEGCYLEVAPPAATGICGFGGAVAGLGRFGGGGAASRPLFAVGASDLTAASTRIGKVFVYRVTGTRPSVAVELVATISGDTDDFHFGSSVCGVGDVNGDGIDDMVVGVSRKGQTPPVAGRAYVVLGNARFSGAGLSEGVVAGGSSPTDGYVPLGNLVAADYFGTSCSRAGDMDGDGIADIVLSAPGDRKVYVIRGRADLDSNPSMHPPYVATVTHASFSQPGELSAGLDVDGDGLADLVIGDTNAVYVFRGDVLNGVSATPATVFTMPAPTVSTGFPVLLAPSLRDALPGEQAFPDVVVGKVAGPSLSIRY